MLFADWKLALLSLASLPLGLLTMGMMFKIGMSRMGTYYAAAAKMNNTIIECINGMEVVKVFNRDGESYARFENDINYDRDMTLDWYRIESVFDENELDNSGTDSLPARGIPEIEF